METTTEVRMFAVTAYKLELLQEKAKKLNKRAVKLGLDIQPIVITDHGTESREIEFQTSEYNSIKLKVTVHKITIQGEAPQLNGWKFLATIEHMGEGNIVRCTRSWEDLTIPEKYWHIDKICDHCKLDRRRKDTYLLHSEHEGFKQVGRSCLKDFLGHGSPEAMANWATDLSYLIPEEFDLEDWEDPDREGWNELKADLYAPIETALTIARTLIRIGGYVSVKDAGIDQMSTKEALTDYMFTPPLKRMGWMNQLESEIGDKDKADAQACIEWIKSLDPKHSNGNYEFEMNLKVLVDAEHASHRAMGYVGGMMFSYIRQRDKAKEEKEQFTNEHFGTVKKRERFALKVLWQKELESYSNYSVLPTLLIKFVDDKGRVANWFTTADSAGAAALEDVKDGEWVVIKATVKKHDEYQGLAQTLLTRCKVETTA